jgi:uncharacterized protein (DUF2384 family)
MSTVMAVAPNDMRKARRTLGLTQVQLGEAFGGVRPETISRWERASSRFQLKVRPLHAEIMRQLTQATDLLQELFPDKEALAQFLNTPQRELGNRTPREAMLEDPPYGLRDVVNLLGRMAEGIPT